MLDEHAAAFLALLQADAGPPQLNVHDGKVPAGVNVDADPYVLVYFAAVHPDTTKEGAGYGFQLRATCHSVGGNAQAARMVADRVAAAVFNQTPAVSGRACFPVEHEDGQPPIRDETTGSLVMDLIDTYVLYSIPG